MHFVLLCAFSIADAEPAATDNHFLTTENRSQPPKQPQPIDPLAAYPAAQYAVHGIIVMGRQCCCGCLFAA